MASRWPRTAQNGPKVAQNGPKWLKTAQNGPIWPHSAPKWPQNGASFAVQIWHMARPQIYVIRCAPAGYLVAVSVPFGSVTLPWAIWDLF